MSVPLEPIEPVYCRFCLAPETPEEAPFLLQGAYLPAPPHRGDTVRMVSKPEAWTVAEVTWLLAAGTPSVNVLLAPREVEPCA